MPIEGGEQGRVDAKPSGVGRGPDEDGAELRAFESFIRYLPGAWWVKDGSGKYLYANAAAAASLGAARERVVGRTDFDLLPDDVAESLRAHDEQVLRTGENLEVLEQVPGADGTLRSWFSAKFPLPVGDERCAAGFAIEVSPVVRAKRDVENTLQQVLDAISDMVLVKGPQSKLEWANKAFLETYGMTNAELSGQVDAPFAEPDVTQQYVKDDHYVFSTGRTLDIPEEPMIRHDGKVLTCHTVKSPIFDAHGNVVKTVAVIRDTTERKRLELELMQAQKLESVGRLASGIAHEINTPVQFIGDQAAFMRSALDDLLTLCLSYRAFVDRCAEGGASAEDVAAIRSAEERADLDFVVENVPKAIESIVEGTQRVGGLVRAMKEFGHPDRGEKSPTDLNRALENTVKIAANELKYVADVELALGVLPEVTCYGSELNQVFLNLLVNSAHAIGEAMATSGGRGKITITTHQEGSDAIILIQDTGTGIPDAIRSKVFDAFFTTKAVGRGTGQGLAMARMIVVAKHGGTLTFESEVGVGTTFRIKIPIGAN